MMRIGPLLVKQRQLLYMLSGHSTSGANPGLMIRDRRRANGVGPTRSPGRDLDPCLPSNSNFGGEREGATD